MDARKIILAWSFGEDKYSDWNTGDTPHKEMKIQDSDNDSLCAVILPNRGGTEKTLKKILIFIADEAKKFNGTHMILLHETRLDQYKNIQSFLKDGIGECLKECKYEFFGGGPEKHKIIYKKLLTETVLFRNEAFHRLNVIKNDVFNAIWDEYGKKKLVRLKYDILSDFCPIVIDIRGLKECAKRKDDAENYLGEIKKEDWALFSEDSLNKYDWPSDELRKEINQSIKNISSLGKIIEAQSTTPQDVINIMYSKQFNIDDWYSNLGKICERYTYDENSLLREQK